MSIALEDLKALSDIDRAYQKEAEEKRYMPSKWSRLSGKEHTDKMFDKEIVQGMAEGLYQKVLSPAIQKANQNEKSCVKTRDSI